MNIEYHTMKAQMILDNTARLYEREQAIFKLYLLNGDHDKFTRQLINLAGDVVATTNLVETADPHMHGAMFDKVQANIYHYMIDEYHDEFVKWYEVKDGNVVMKEVA